MVPGVKPDLVPGGGAVAQDLFVAPPDGRAGPGRPHEEDVHAVQPGGVRAEHLEQEGRLQQTPQVSPHVVRANREEIRRADAVAVHRAKEGRHPPARAAERIDVYADGDLHFLIPNSPEEMACWRKKSSVCLMDSRRGTTGFQPQYFMALRMLGLRCWQS